MKRGEERLQGFLRVQQDEERFLASLEMTVHLACFKFQHAARPGAGKTWLSAGAVFADGFVDQSVEFAAGQAHMIARGVDAVRSHREFGTATWGRHNEVS